MKGDTGPQGVQGIQGPQGEQGSPGESVSNNLFYLSLGVSCLSLIIAIFAIFNSRYK